MAGLFIPATHFHSGDVGAGTGVVVLNGLRFRSEGVEVSVLCSVVRLLDEISI